MFTSHVVTRKLAVPINGQKYADIHERTEKGSDVNLACHLLNDAWLDKYDCAVVISGDSDLAESIQLVRQYHRKKVVGVVAPGKRGMSKKLIACSNFVRTLSTASLAKCQLPGVVGSISKPHDW